MYRFGLNESPDCSKSAATPKNPEDVIVHCPRFAIEICEVKKRPKRCYRTPQSCEGDVGVGTKLEHDKCSNNCDTGKVAGTGLRLENATDARSNSSRSSGGYLGREMEVGLVGENPIHYWNLDQ